jgi:hypothetical protein
MLIYVLINYLKKCRLWLTIDRPDLSSKRAPYKDTTVIVNSNKHLIMRTRWSSTSRHTDWLTDWLTVSRNVTLTLTFGEQFGHWHGSWKNSSRRVEMKCVFDQDRVSGSWIYWIVIYWECNYEVNESRYKIQIVDNSRQKEWDNENVASKRNRTS